MPSERATTRAREINSYLAQFTYRGGDYTEDRWLAEQLEDFADEENTRERELLVLLYDRLVWFGHGVDTAWKVIVQEARERLDSQLTIEAGDRNHVLLGPISEKPGGYLARPAPAIGPRDANPEIVFPALPEIPLDSTSDGLTVKAQSGGDEPYQTGQDLSIPVIAQDTNFHPEENRGGDVTFTPGRGYAPLGYVPQHGRFIFRLPDDVEILRLDPDGNVFVRGILERSDKALVDAFAEWMATATAHYDTPECQVKP